MKTDDTIPSVCTSLSYPDTSNPAITVRNERIPQKQYVFCSGRNALSVGVGDGLNGGYWADVEERLIE